VADDRELSGLLRDLEPDAALEQLTVTALRQRGLLGAASTRPSVTTGGGGQVAAAWTRRAVAIAAAVTLFVAGMGVGRITSPAVGAADKGPAGDLADSFGQPAEVGGPNEGRSFLADASTRAGAGETRVIQWF